MAVLLLQSPPLVKTEAITPAASDLVNGNIRVLVVDDEEGVRRSVGAQLSPAGFEVLTAATGEEAIQKFRSERISIVLLDIFLPGKDGFETLMEIRRYLPEAKVITISGECEYRGIDLLHWSMKLGAIATLRKPFGPKQAIEAINAALGRT